MVQRNLNSEGIAAITPCLKKIRYTDTRSLRALTAFFVHRIPRRPPGLYASPILLTTRFLRVCRSRREYWMISQQNPPFDISRLPYLTHDKLAIRSCVGGVILA